jgi:ATP-dependent DNA helicase PIF1
MSEQKLNDILLSISEKRNIIIHSCGGTGKTFTLKLLAENLRSQNKKVYVTSSTGVSALNFNNISESTEGTYPATTLHRFAGIGLGESPVNILINKMKIYNKRAVKNWQKCDILIIDEISMIGGTLFQKLDEIAKILRGNNLPFGGIQLIVSGDFLQLPPVKDIWIFKTKEWEDLDFCPFIFDIPFRYTGEESNDFFQMLLRIRVGKQNENDIKILKGRVCANQKIHNILNDLDSKNDNNLLGEVIRPTMLYSLKCDVEAFNNNELDKLPGKLVTFTSVDTVIKNSKSDNDKKGLEEEYMRLLEQDMPRRVSFKVGAQVMLRKNLSVEEGMINGSRGVVVEIIPEEALVVKFLNGKKVRVELSTRTIEDKYFTVIRIQIPFILAYATTIHKCQGSTLDYVIVDLGYSVFSEGQAYVALSRCRNIKGLFISEFTPSSILVNYDALEYVKTLENKSKK